MNNIPRLYLKNGKEQSLKRLHPWVFSGAVQGTTVKPEEGQLVDIYSAENVFLARGHFQPDSILVRIITFQEEDVNELFWTRKLATAIELRKTTGLYDSHETNVFRLVHGEGDFMPGLVIDFYNGIAVMQCHSAGMYLVRHRLAECLKQLMGDKLLAVYDKSEGTLPFKFQGRGTNGFILGEAPLETEVQENGFRFLINIADGQKTGFFVDQRENRKLLGHYSSGKVVGNMFGYTGGFSVYALGAGASIVHSVDSSARAMEMTDKNIHLNACAGEHGSFTADVLDYVKDIQDKYDVIILDPPAFAKHGKNLSNALQAYKRLNAAAIRAIRKGGVLFTFSCSQVVSRDDFRRAVFAASASTGREVRILHQLTQPDDHPVSMYHPEGEYLKGLVLHIA